VGKGFIIPKGDGILLIHHDVLLKMRALQRGGTGLGLVQVRTSYRHNLVEGADGLAGGFYPQAVCQVEGLNSIIECGGAEVGSTGGVSQGVRVDSRLRSIIVDVSGKSGLLGSFASSTSFLATSASAASLSLGRSVSARTAVGPALLLLLLGKLGVSWLALHSAKLVGLGALTTAASGAFLLKRERGSLHNTFRFEILDLVGGHLTENLSYDIHSRRELA